MLRRATLALFVLALSGASGLVSGCASGAPATRAASVEPVASAAVPGDEASVAEESVCEIPAWGPPRAIVLEVPVVPSAIVTRACEALAARATEALRAPIPPAWRAAHEEARRDREESDPDDYVPDPVEELADMRAGVGVCVPAGTGAWTTEALDERFDEDIYVLVVRVVHLDADGSVHAGEPLTLHVELWGTGLSIHSLSPVFDFDADGRFEVALQLRGSGDHTRLLTASGGGVRDVSLPLEIGTAHWIDFDADGRPDLLADRLYVQYECYEGDSGWGMPSLLLHASDGLTFSADDAMARRYAEGLCPCAPTRLLAPPIHGTDEPLFSEQTLVRIACARLWGVGASVIELRLAAEIETLTEAQRHEGDVCAGSVETLSAFADATPPLRLTR